MLREKKESALLGLLFLTGGALMGEVKLGGCLGYSDYEAVKFKIFGTMKKAVSRGATQSRLLAVQRTS